MYAYVSAAIRCISDMLHNAHVCVYESQFLQTTCTIKLLASAGPHFQPAAKLHFSLNCSNYFSMCSPWSLSFAQPGIDCVQTHK